MRENFIAWNDVKSTTIFQDVLKNIQEARDKEAIAAAIDLLKGNGYKVFQTVTTVTLTEM